MSKKQEYNASSIKALTPREHLLKRMSLVFGSEKASDEYKFSTQKGVAVREILDNAVDEALAGYANRIRVHFYQDQSIEIQDNGRGIPPDTGVDSAGKKANGIYLALGLLQSGGKFETDANRFSSGLNGLGASAVVNTSTATFVTVFRDNKRYTLHFKEGVPGYFKNNDPNGEFTELKDYAKINSEKDNRPTNEKKLFKTGTIVKTWLDEKAYMSKFNPDYNDLIERLKGTSFLVPNLIIDITNEHNLIENPETGEKEFQKEIYCFTDGIKEIIEVNQNKKPLIPIIKVTTEANYIEKDAAVLEKGKIVRKDIEKRIPIEVAFSYDEGYDTHLESYVNTIKTRLGGVHEMAFEKAMTTSYGEKIISMRGMVDKKVDKLLYEDFAEGLTAVLSIKISEPQFTSQSKEELGGKEAQKAITLKLIEEFDKWINSPKNSNVLKIIGQKVAIAAKNRVTAREQRDLNRQKNRLEGSTEMPAKLLDCKIVGDENSELFIVEGSSAMGSLKAARVPNYQAVLPLRGKVINAFKSSPRDLLANKEVQDIIKCIGTGIGDKLDIEKLRYNRIIITTDADPDGGAIACSLLALFWTLFRPLVEGGHIFKSELPLFEIKIKGGKNERIYCRDEKERDKAVSRLEKRGKKFTVTRLKGLGEMNDDSLRETATDPETRIITKITVKDIAQAEKMLDITMGENPELRKQWIEENPDPNEEINF